MRKSWLVLTIMTLLLRSNGALALVDISGKDKVEVGSWGELKAAVADSANAGKVIVLTGNITADKANPITSVGGAGIIIDGNGHTITGQTGSTSGQFIQLGSDDNTDLIIQNVNFEGFVRSGSNSVNGGVIYNSGMIGDITGDFSSNYAKSEKYFAAGGAIYNSGTNATIGDITGDFSGNYAKSTSSSYVNGSASGGAIDNFETIGDISGDFSGNFAQSDSGSALGGAIYNRGIIGDISGTFTGNYAQSDSGLAAGGAIDNSYGTFGDISGDFSGNYAQSTSSYAQGGAIDNSGTMTLVNSSFYDNYVETGALRDSNAGQQTAGGAIFSTGNLTIRADAGESIFRGNKVIWGDGEDSSAIMAMGITLDSVNGGLIQFDDKISGRAFSQTMSKGEVESLIKDAGTIGLEVKQEGENYIVSGSIDGVFYTYQIIKQTDEIYKVTVLSGEMSITGDDSSKVVFNNAIENMAQIDISGTNVDVNEGVGTISNTITHDNGVLNINANAKAEDSVINDGGTMNVADKATASRTEVNSGGVLNVAAGGLAEDTTINSGGLLNAAAQATINNMLANDGAILEIDRDAYLTGNIIIHATATMGGSYDYSNIFKDEVTDAGSLTLVGGLNDILNESSLINNVESKKLNLTAGDYAIGDGAQAVQGWDVLSFKNNANVKLEGDIAMSDAKKLIYIENGSKLDLAGHSPSNYTITGSLANDGMVTFSHADDEADDVTTIYGNYLAYNNAQMTIDVNPLTNTSDMMIVDGDVQGTTLVTLNVLNEAKPSEKILFVEALNDNPATGAAFYTQDGHIFGSPYKWNVLYENNRWYVGTDDVIPDGSINGYGDSDLGEITDESVLESGAVLPPNFPDTPSSSTGDANTSNGNNSVVFRKPSVVGEVIAYMGLPSAGIEQTRDMTRNVSSKVASTKIYSQQCHGYYDCEYNGQGLRNAWASPVYSYSEVDAPYKYEAEIAGVDAGLDLQADAHNRLGVFVSSRYGNYDFDGKGDDYYSKTGSEIDIDSYILGLYYRYDGGKYWAMSQVFGGYQDVDIASDDGFGSTTDGIVFGGSFESGLTFTPRKDVVVEPTMRVGYTQINYDKLKDNYGKTADFDDVRNIEIEAGVKIEKAFARDRGFGKVYIKPSVIQNIGSGDVKVTGLQSVEGLEDATLGRVEVGGSMSFNDNWSTYFFAAYTFGSDYKNASINAGLNYAF